MRTDSYNPPAERDVFAYLDDLHGSGIVNMFGAPSRVVREFGCSRQEANDFVSEWMNTYYVPGAKAGHPVLGGKMKVKVRKRRTVEIDATIEHLVLEFSDVASMVQARPDKPRCDRCRRTWEEAGSEHIAVLVLKEVAKNWVICDECAAEAQAEILA